MPDVTQVVMPQLGETVTEGTITRWFKQSGDEVAEDEELFEVSTDKVDTTVPSAVAGVVLEILVPEGDTAEVGVPLALIGPLGSSPNVGASSAATAGTSNVSSAATTTRDAATTDASASAPPPAASVATAERVGAGPPVEHGGNGHDAPLARAGRSEPGAFLSPVVRRLLAEHRLDPAEIPGTGEGGRVTRDDVLAAARARDDGRPPAPTPTMGPIPAGPNDAIVPLSTLRKRIARHLTDSLHTAAHALVVMEVDYSCVDAVRDRMRSSFREQEGFALTYLPFVARAVVDTIGRFPHLNATLDGDDLVVHRDFHLGIAVDLDYEGLVVPVIHHADGKTFRAIAREITELAAKARASALTPDDLAGGTFTITNAGGYGTFVTAPIINLPQVAILSTDGVKMRPVAVALDGGGYGVAVHPVGNLALSFDHRVFDGAYASAFLAAVVGQLEDHEWATELAAGAQHRAPAADAAATPKRQGGTA